MHYIPPTALRGHNIEALLAARGLNPDWFNTDDNNPHGPANVARFTYSETAKVVPYKFQTAISSLPQLRVWIDGLVAGAREDQTERGAPVASVNIGPSLLLLGATGVGKTHEAYGAMRELAVTGVSARWATTTAADLYAALRPRHGVDSETEFRRYRGARLLLVDDLGAERKPTEFTEEINFRLINYRYENHLPTLFTSNVDPKQLGERLGDRVTSRLVEMCQRVAMKGNDRRRGGA